MMIQIEIDTEDLAKAKKKVWVKPTATKKGHYREMEVGRKEEEKEFSDVVETKEIPLEEKLWFKSANFALNTKVVSKAFDDIFKKMGKNLDNPDFSFFVEGKKFEGINMETFKLYVACQNDFSRGKKHNRLSIIVENVETEREYKIVEITNLQREDLDLDEKKEQIKKKFLRLGL